MCKCCQSCLETIWWHLIEKRFCYDENIALYEVPEKQEKNNNMFENIAFYDSVSVIAGRAVVTVEPLPEKRSPSLRQMARSRSKSGSQKWNEKGSEKKLSKSAPDIAEKLPQIDVSDEIEPPQETEYFEVPVLTKTTSNVDIIKPRKDSFEVNKSSIDLTDWKVRKTGDLLVPDNNLRRNSLIQRRQSKSLYLKIVCVGDQCKEVPIIRQSSMPKFFLDSPEERQRETALFRTPSTALTSPVPVTNKHGFIYDLSSVVQMEKEKAWNDQNSLPQVHDNPRREFRDKIVKLKRIRSAMSAFQSHHM